MRARRRTGRRPTASATRSRRPASPSKIQQTEHTGVTAMAKPARPGSGNSKKKGALKGTGGNGRKSLEGRGPTPKAEDRAWHVAGKRKAAAERYAAAGGKGPSTGSGTGRGGG